MFRQRTQHAQQRRARLLADRLAAQQLVETAVDGVVGAARLQLLLQGLAQLAQVGGHVWAGGEDPFGRAVTAAVAMVPGPPWTPTTGPSVPMVMGASGAIPRSRETT